MKPKKEKLVNIENFIDDNQMLPIKDQTFEKLMFFYSTAMKELETKIQILKEECSLFYSYDLIDHIDTRIKKVESIMQKMKKRKLAFTYKNMIENINDIAGIRIICPLKKDIFSVKNLIQRFPGIHILKEKDYITYPKKSGYSSYHLIVEVPVTLSQQNIYVKVEIQIRTIAMDFWSTLEHKRKYKAKQKLSPKEARKWINYAKMINQLDNQLMLLHE